MTQSQKDINPYLFLGILAVIWGSSFILMKEGLKAFSSYEVATMRIAIAGIVLIPFVKWNKLKIDPKDYKYFIISGFLGSAIPAFLFTAAQTHISSSLAGAINGLTPLFALLVGVMFLGVKFNKWKIYGVVVGLLGAFFLIGHQSLDANPKYAMFAVAAAICYGINVNIIKEKLGKYPPMVVTAVPLAIIAICAIIYLLFNPIEVNIIDIHSQDLKSLLAVTVLAVFGTSLSLVMFNRLIQQTNTIFATSVTYLIPIVALFWGYLDGEQITSFQVAGLVCILIAIWLIRKDNQPVST